MVRDLILHHSALKAALLTSTATTAWCVSCFPMWSLPLSLVEDGDGNRLSELTLTTQWLNAALAPSRTYQERYVGIGASYSDTTIELRYRTAMDSVGASFPARTLTRSLVGPLPLNAELVLQ
jgi:hypothetical protein